MNKKSMNKWTVVLSAVFVVSLFSVVIGAMAATGKIKLFDTGDSEQATIHTSDNNYINTDAKSDNSTNNEVSPNSQLDNGEKSEVVEPVTQKIENLSAAPAQAEKYTSITDVATDTSGNVYAADATGKKLYKLNSSGSVLATYVASSKVNGVCVKDSEVYLLEGELAGKVTVLNSSNLTQKKTIEVGHTPNAMVVNGTTGYVANRFSNTVSVINLSTYAVTNTISIDGREPEALALAKGKVYVACHLPEDSSESNVIAANIVVIDTNSNKVTKTMNLTNGSGGVKDICASPSGDTIYVSHIIARYAYPTTQLDRGWINTNAISIINTSGDELVTSVLLDELELGAANPWGLAVSGDGSKLICALSGTDEAMIININSMNSKINAVKNGNGLVRSLDRIPDYLPFLDDCRERIALSGKGAREVSVNGNNAYVGLYFDGTVDRINLSNNTVTNMSFTTQPESDDIRMGEIIFSDATLCYQKWQSCLSCHPDARVDGYNWDNLNDGMGNPKSAKSMLYSHRTPPVMSTGIRATAEIAVRAGMKYIQFNALGEEQMAQIDEYLKSLKPVQSPYLNRNGTLTESASRGKELFESTGCIKCHPAPLYTDLKLHPSRAAEDTSSWENRDMDTPSLVEVWRTGPWVFDGRFSTMEETVRYYTNGQNLTDNQIKDLVNYVMSIGDEEELYGVEQILVESKDTTAINSIAPGSKISQLTVRCQNEQAPATAVVTITLNTNGKDVQTITKKIENMSFGSSKLIKLDTPISVPDDIASGTRLTVSIKDTQDKPLATDLVLIY